MIPRNLEQHFWSHVWRCTHGEECALCCWPYLPSFAASIGSRRGMVRYGSYYIIGTAQATNAHRIAYMLAHHAGLLPFGQQVGILHKCDFRPCCNPSHLFAGTVKDNHKDRVSKQNNRKPITFPNGSQMHPLGHTPPEEVLRIVYPMVRWYTANDPFANK